MRTIQIASCLLLGTVFLAGCTESNTPTELTDTPLFSSTHGVVHHVSMGGEDPWCRVVWEGPTGCDANFSLVAREHANGSVSGQWQDVFGPLPNNGEFGFPAFPVHLKIDCLHVVGNEAWVGGFVTKPKGFSEFRSVIKVVDNGNSVNDPPDQTSLSFADDGTMGCTTEPELLGLFDVGHGQVVVR